MNTQKHTNLAILLLIGIGIFLRFYNLNWGSPFYFHPDERNIAASVSQLSFPNQMNPHFFAYGSLPIYAIYFAGAIFHLFQVSLVGFEEAIIISRLYSALFSTLLIPFIFFLGKKIKDEKTGLIAAFLTTTSVGLIQFAHFGTFEMWLTFFGVLLFWICLKIPEKKNHAIFSSAVIFGVLIAIKISSVILLVLPLVAVILSKNKPFKKLLNIVSIMLISVLVYFLTNPFVALDQNSFISSMKYESGVVLGSMEVFYTGSFFNTIPVIFQFLHIYPFLLNPLLTIIFLPAFIYLIYKGIKTKNHSYLILATFYLILFLPQAFLFAKWTRYMTPTLPFVYLIIAVAVSDLWQFRKKVFSIFVFANIIFSLSYFITAFVQPDTRIVANNFAQNNIPQDAKIISEPYDLGLTTFNKFKNNIIVNFYDEPEINAERADYIILPSQRIMRSRLLNGNEFAKGYVFYSNLASGKLGYIKIYETPCDIFCKITYLNNPIFGFEETASVFDRPTVFIYKKMP